jgi:hypothetical protein
MDCRWFGRDKGLHVVEEALQEAMEHAGCRKDLECSEGVCGDITDETTGNR